MDYSVYSYGHAAEIHDFRKSSLVCVFIEAPIIFITQTLDIPKDAKVLIQGTTTVNSSSSNISSTEPTSTTMTSILDGGGQHAFFKLRQGASLHIDSVTMQHCQTSQSRACIESREDSTSLTISNSNLFDTVVANSSISYGKPSINIGSGSSSCVKL